MLSSIACAVDLDQSLPFRPIDVAKTEGVNGSIRKVSELGIAETVQAEELDYLHGECCLAPGKIGRYDSRRLRFWWNLGRYYRRLLGFWGMREGGAFGGTLAGVIVGGGCFT